jgi:hypothetical protein
MHLVDPEEKWQWAARGAQGTGDRFDQSKERRTGYAYYMPQMTQDQFHMVSSPRFCVVAPHGLLGVASWMHTLCFWLFDKELTRDV